MIPKKLPKLNSINKPAAKKTSKPVKEVAVDGKKPHLPKTEYDENGNPKLMIPDMDDLNLDGMMGKYLNS